MDIEHHPDIPPGERDPAAVVATPVTSRRGDRRAAIISIAALAAMAVAIVVLRLKTFDEPPERDLVTYMFVGHALLHGGNEYTAAYEIKPPGVFALYALAELICGMGPGQLYLLSVAAALATLVGVYFAGAALNREAGLWAAAFWVLLCGAPGLQANQPNTEAFINALLVWALALLIRWPVATRSAAPAVVIGILFALASTMKQLVVIDAILFSCIHLAVVSGLPGGRRRAVHDVAIMAGVGAIVWVLLIGYYAATGRSGIFLATVFALPRAYGGNPLFNLFRYVREAQFLPAFLWFAIPVMGLVLLGMIRDRRTVLARPWAFYLAAIAAIQLKIPLNGPKFLPHYYQYWLPILAFGAGWAAGKSTTKAGAIPSWTMTVAGLIVAAFLAVEEGRFYLRSADNWSRLKYDNLVIEARDLGRALRRVLTPEAVLYVHGNKPEIYYEAGQVPRVPVFWVAHFNDTWPVTPLLIGPQSAALRAVPPDLVVVHLPDTRAVPESGHRVGFIGRLFTSRQQENQGLRAREVLERVLADGDFVECGAFPGFDNYRFYVRRGTRLAERLRHFEVAASPAGL